MSTTLQKKPEQKRVSISSKRQFTIPQKFYSELGFGTEAICTMGEGILIIQPVFETENREFAEKILADLIAEGLSGQQLLDEFKRRQAKVRPAVEELLDAARRAAKGSGKSYSYDDVFGAEE